MTFKEVAMQWFATRYAGWLPARAEDVLSLIKSWPWVISNTPAAQVSYEMVAARFAARRSEVSASRVNREGGILRSIFKEAVARGLVARDVSPAWLSVPVVTEKEPRSISEEEEAALLAVAPEPLGRLIQFALATGLRAGTLRALTWEMVEDRADGPALVLPARVMKARRPEVLPLSTAARRLLGVRGSPLFGGWKDYELSRAFARVVERAGLPDDITFHSLRATFATRLLARGVPVAQVMRLGCWKSADVLLRHYAARSPMAAERAALEAACV